MAKASSQVRRVGRVAVVAVALIGLGACADDGSGVGGPTSAAAAPSEVTADLVGTVDGSDAYVALVADGGSLRAYVCDGVEGAAAGIAEWFSGDVNGGQVELESDGGARLVATVSASGAEGTFTAADGTTHAFHADAAEGDAGLYRGESGDLLGGFIVANDGTDRGGLGVQGVQRARPAFQPSSPTIRLADVGSVQFERVGAG